MQYTVLISATKQQVWSTIWGDETFRTWASIIDPGTYMVGELKEGGEVQFISAENGYGVTSTVVRLIPYEYVLLQHKVDTQNAGADTREEQWAGTSESYALSQIGSETLLTLLVDVPLELKDYFSEAYPRALTRIKELAENLK